MPGTPGPGRSSRDGAEWSARPSRPPPGVRFYAGYLAVQAVAGVGLWLVMAASAAVRSGFELMADHRSVTDAFMYPDLAVTVVASGLSAWGVATGRRWAVPVVAATAGTVLYPTVYLMVWVSRHHTASVALGVMVVVSVMTTWIAVQVYRGGLPTGG